jgi:hypothetical protein
MLIVLQGALITSSKSSKCKQGKKIEIYGNADSIFSGSDPGQYRTDGTGR